MWITCGWCVQTVDNSSFLDFWPTAVFLIYCICNHVLPNIRSMFFINSLIMFFKRQKRASAKNFWKHSSSFLFNQNFLRWTCPYNFFIEVLRYIHWMDWVEKLSFCRKTRRVYKLDHCGFLNPTRFAVIFGPKGPFSFSKNSVMYIIIHRECLWKKLN